VAGSFHYSFFEIIEVIEFFGIADDIDNLDSIDNLEKTTLLRRHDQPRKVFEAAVIHAFRYFSGGLLVRSRSP
jgi:hypothetical protein